MMGNNGKYQIMMENDVRNAGKWCKERWEMLKNDGKRCEEWLKI